MTNLKKYALLVLDGRISFDRFAAATRPEFGRMAASLTRRWIPPPWHAHEDVVQDLLLGAWLTMWSWDEARGTDLHRFVVYNAMSWAKRELHRARGAKLSGSPDRNPSRIPRTFDPLPAHDEDGASFDDMVNNLAAEDAIAEDALIEREERASAIANAVGACATPIELRIVSAIIEAGTIEGGASRIFDDFEQRIALRLPSEEHAARFAMRVAVDVMGRIDAERAS